MTPLIPQRHGASVPPRGALSVPRIRTAAILAWGICCSGLWGTDLYVAPPPAGVDTNAGTIATPVATIQEAVDRATPGTTIHLRAGIYRELVRPRSQNSGTAGSPVVIRAYDSDEAGPLLPESVTVSGYDVVQPGQEGAGTWEPVAGRSDVWKIQLTANHGLAHGRNQVKYDGATLCEARWPDAAYPGDRSYLNMAAAEAGSTVNLPPNPTVPGTYSATYIVNNLPADNWVGATVMFSPGKGFTRDSAMVTSQTASTISFDYLYRGASYGAKEGDPFFIQDSLAALSTPGEAFFDVDGVSGDAHVLYVYSPDGSDPSQRVVELRSKREHPGSPTQSSDAAFFFTAWARHFTLKDFTIDGATLVAVEGQSSYIAIDGVSVINTIGRAPTAVQFGGDWCEVRNSLIDGSGGVGVSIGDNGVIRNTVIRDTLDQAFFPQGTGIVFENNTVYNTAGVAIDIGGPNAVLRRNNVYKAGLWLTDVAALNSCSSGDAGGTEIAYNWVHSCYSRVDGALSWGGAMGIRLDSGCGYPGVSGYDIHHNILWKLSSQYQVLIWPLQPADPNYDAMNVRLYHNTVEGYFWCERTGTLGGLDMRNNLLQSSSTEPGIIDTASYFRTNLFYQKDLPDNLTGAPGFAAPLNGDFRLLDSSQARGAGEVTPYSSGPNPDLGALPYGESAWIAGAKLLPEDYAQINVQLRPKSGGGNEVYVTGLPAGRLVPESFRLKIGPETSTSLFAVLDADDHRSEAHIEIDLTGLTGAQAVSYSIDGVTFQSHGTIEFPQSGQVQAQVGSGLEISPIEGGTEHTLEGVVSSNLPYFLAPITFENFLGQDLVSIPVPIIIDTASPIAAGHLRADGGDLRVREIGSSSGGWTENVLDIYIDSGLNTARTLVWVRYAPGQTPLGGDFYATYGDPGLSTVSNPAVLIDYYDELAHPALQSWLKADDFGVLSPNPVPVGNWLDRSGKGHDAVQTVVDKQPLLTEGAISDFPALSFDGTNDYFDLGHLVDTSDGITLLYVHHSPDLGPSPNRLFSSNAVGLADHLSGGFVMDGLPSPTGEPLLRHTYSATNVNMTDATIGARHKYKNSTTYGGHYNGAIGEVLIYSERLLPNTASDVNNLVDYLHRKWELSEVARGRADTATPIPPLELYLGTQRVWSYILDTELEELRFTAPAASSGYTLPAVLDIKLVVGTEETILPGAFVYYSSTIDPAMDLDADPDGDGLTNFFEYAFNTDAGVPRAASESPEFEFDSAGPDLDLVFRRNKNAADVLFYIETSTDLVFWVEQSLESLGWIVVDPDVDGDGETERLSVALPVPAQGSLFARIKIHLLSAAP